MTVNGDSEWLVLDSGAGRTGFDRSWARQLGVRLPWAPDSSWALVDTIHLESLTLRNYVVNLYGMRSVSEAAGRFQAGLLGQDFLQHFAVEIDYGEQVVRLHDRARYLYQGTGVILPFASHYEDPVVDVLLQRTESDWTKARLLLDTGNGHLCFILMTPFVEKHHLTRIAPAIEGPLITGIVGPLRIAVGNVAALRLGTITLDSVPTGLGRERKSFLTIKDFDGVAGSTLFHGGRLILDYYRRRAIVDPGPGVGRDCKYDESGLILTARGPDYRDFVVEYVVDRSPAADAGIRPGDQILSIDDRPTADLRLPEIRQLLTVDGATCQLRLLRGDDTLAVTLTLGRLF